MPAVKFFKCLVLRKIAILGQAPRQKHPSIFAKSTFPTMPSATILTTDPGFEPDPDFTATLTQPFLIPKRLL